jgi:hypothetical protein
LSFIGIDPAFASRIHVNIEYPELSKVARLSVWTNFLAQSNPKHVLKAHKITADDLDKLSELEMNGRQIKNTVKTAQLLASHNKVALEAAHIWKVLTISEKPSA